MRGDSELIGEIHIEPFKIIPLVSFNSTFDRFMIPDKFFI